MINTKIGRLTVIELAEIKPGYYKFWKCRCECGNTIVAAQTHLKTGHTKSCGCLQREITIKRSTTHGLRKSPAYNSWRGMKERCTNPRHREWPNYGGRGITMCDEWLNSFEQFYADMGESPFPRAHIDRINNDKGYYKQNCAWVTPKENSRKKRNTIWVTYQGVTLCLAEWSEIIGVRYQTLVRRHNDGLPSEKILAPYDMRGGQYA